MSSPATPMYAALNLVERAALPIAPAVEPTPRAIQRLGQWRQLPAWPTPVTWRARLTAAGLDENRLLGLLDESTDSLRRRCRIRPDWIEAVTTPAPGSGSRVDYASWSPRALLPALSCIEPMIERARTAVNAHFVAHLDGRRTAARHRLFEATEADSITLPGLVDDLVVLLSRAVVLELNLARQAGILAGSSPQERFDNYLSRLRGTGGRRFLTQYPVLARRCVQTIDQWLRSSIEFLERLSADGDRLRRGLLANESDPRVISATAAGDPHQGGRRVLILQTTGGRRFVYKPRPLEIDRHFYDLLAWTTAQTGLTFAAPQLEFGDRYGWSSYVGQQDLTTSTAADHFYRRLGMQLTWLTVLGGSDIHAGNLVAQGDHPVIIDLETCLSPSLLVDPRRHERSIDDLSVLATGLLPVPATDGYTDGSSAEARDREFDGLAGGRRPHRCGCTAWVNEGTDTMHLGHGTHHESGGPHLPTHVGVPIDPLDHVEALIDGFDTAYRLLYQRRTELGVRSGLIQAFSRDELRVIVRPTRRYARLLEAALHPDYLRDGLDRDRLLDMIHSGTEILAAAGSVVDAERQDLDQGDVPLFRARAGSQEVNSSDDSVLNNLIDRTALERALAGLDHLSDRDRDRQVWLIRASCVPRPDTRPEATPPDYAEQRWTPEHPSSHNPPITAGRLVDQAATLGQQILQLFSQPDGSWRTLDHHPVPGWHISSADATLYGGSAGIAFFFAHLADLTGVMAFRSAADRHTARLASALMAAPDPSARPGGFDGWSGLYYYFCHAAALGHTGALGAARQMMDRQSAGPIPAETATDLTSGSAGAILGLLSSPGELIDRALALAIRHGEHLLLRSTRWIHPRSPVHPPLGGLGHGAAGEALALAELARATGQSRFVDGVDAAVAYQTHLYDSTAMNWRDLRDDRRPFAQTWCHGASGIGISWIRLQELGHPGLGSAIDAALGTVAAGGFGRNHSLCHGDLGNLDLLLAAQQRGLLPVHTLDRYISLVVGDASRHGWRCAAPRAIPTPGLMTGWAGIGYQLLRLAQPHAVPDVLRLAAPVAGPAPGQNEVEE